MAPRGRPPLLTGLPEGTPILHAGAVWGSLRVSQHEPHGIWSATGPRLTLSPLPSRVPLPVVTRGESGTST